MTARSMSDTPSPASVLWSRMPKAGLMPITTSGVSLAAEPGRARV